MPWQANTLLLYKANQTFSRIPFHGWKAARAGTRGQLVRNSKSSSRDGGKARPGSGLPGSGRSTVSFDAVSNNEVIVIVY